MYPEPIENLLKFFKRIPSVGEKTALKYVFELLKWNDVDEFSKAILHLKTHIRQCTKCGNLAKSELCPICSDTKRDKTTVCVIAKIVDLFAIENLGEYNGTYHVLHNTLNPLEGITPKELNIEKLLERIKNELISEVILALNPDINGESTALYLQNILRNYNVHISRIAKGLPMGSSLEYADQTTISNAIKGRININK